MDAILYVDNRGSVALPPARLSALEHGLRLLRQMGRRGRVHPAQRPAQAAGREKEGVTLSRRPA
ncbi:hypothetical protein LV779_33865 [Streptomyces thinghirensis]|nr:hypothetical protein [Streptomyces thinghirensis]